jgi:hypothetical protein
MPNDPKEPSRPAVEELDEDALGRVSGGGVLTPVLIDGYDPTNPKSIEGIDKPNTGFKIPL